jgi:large subunit ribosomal protein L25
MSISFEINAEPRSDTGKGANRRLRRAGLVPGIIYGAGKDPAMISVAHNELVRRLENEAFYSHILTVHVGGKQQQVVLKGLQRHPSKPFVTHLDLQRITAGSKITMRVPLNFIGEDVAPALKQGAFISHHEIDAEIICYPKDLPESIDVDLSAMDMGDSMRLSELKLPEGVEIPALAAGLEQNVTIASVQMGAEEEEEVAAEEGEELEGAEEVQAEETKETKEAGEE